MSPETVKRYAAPVPRYTSYPTAPNFSGGVRAPTYLDWLSDLPERAKVSLYAHIPFCRTMCWYCGCSTKASMSYTPVSGYLTSLRQEIAQVSDLVPGSARVTSIHWGGGTPNILTPGDVATLAGAIRNSFSVSAQAEFAVEVDPRTLDEEKIAAFASAGVTRASIGVQDFDDAVQRAINRVQTFEITQRAVEGFREHGIGSINIDLVYGLPHQTRASVTQTISRILQLRPDRIAVFGYAHLPARIAPQRLIDAAALPGVVERFGQQRRIDRLLRSAGYVSVGIDHFALPHDLLAQTRVSRNFQGYTTDDADALIGLGASAIGRLPQGYVQNAVSRDEYARLIRNAGIATVRGFALSDDDRLRGFVIGELMCRFAVSWPEAEARFGPGARQIAQEAAAIAAADVDGLVDATPAEFRITEAGRPFARSICACFDAYADTVPAQHAPAV